MLVSIEYEDLKNFVFIYETKPLLDIYKYIKVTIDKEQIRFINLYKNNYIINYIENDDCYNSNHNSFSFLCYIDDLKNLFSVITNGSNLLIEKIKKGFVYFSNEGTNFKLPIFPPDDFPDIDENQFDSHYKFDIFSYYEELKNILIKSNSTLSEYIAIRTQNGKIYALHTDNYRIHSIEAEYGNIDFSFAIPCYFIDYIGKYNLFLDISLDNKLALSNENTMILLENNVVLKSFKKAFKYLETINDAEYINKFTVNKRKFLEELQKHHVFSNEVYLHIKQNNVILYSINNKLGDSDIKTISHAYNIEFHEHQSFLIDLKFLVDFIKSHTDNSIDIYLNEGNYIYSKTHLCATKRM